MSYETESEDFAFDGSGVALAEPEQRLPAGPERPAPAAEPDVLEQVPKPQWLGQQPVEGAAKQPVYFDLETAADEERMHLFGLPEIREPEPETELASCPPVNELLALTVTGFRDALAKFRPPVEWLAAASAGERQAPKPRQGVLDLIRATADSDPTVAYNAARAERRKLLATTPEFCRIVAVGWAVGSQPPRSIVVEEGEPMIELEVLKFLWRLFRHAQPIIGFNCLHFDLPVLFARSAILGVPSSRSFDLKPWGRDVVDLFAIRFPKGPGAAGGGRPAKLKELARVYGVEVPAGDTDGGDVERLLRESPHLLRQYVESDVAVTRDLHRKWAGYFC
jgi:hypothetical protein